MSVPAAAKALAISERAVRKRIHAGTLRAKPFGRSFMVWLPDDEPLAGPGPGPDPRPEPGPEPGPEPIEASYRVVPAEIERAIERTGARYVADFAQLYDRISTDVGRLYEGQLAAKDELIAELRQRAEAAEAVAGAPDPRVKMLEQQVTTDEMAIAELRRRAELAEAERDRLIAAQVAPAPPHGAETQEGEAHAPDAPGGFLARVRRFFGGGRA